ncbi:MAG: hypothetical protein LBQ54_10125 [Planctomycetaceae bacterium]|jgi:uncharacterized protein YukE|nr:hypothetical protein [Planctomycetaceae bacterium]
MMSQVYVNPEELRSLGSVLADCSIKITEAVGQMGGAVRGCSSWNDTKKQQFEATVAELNNYIAGFHASVHEQILYLNVLASKADEYLST